jgi:hypothetical protein
VESVNNKKGKKKEKGRKIQKKEKEKTHVQ